MHTHTQTHTHTTDAHRGPLGATPKRAPHRVRERSDGATWGGASRRPKSPHESISAHGAAPIWGRL
eukprot:15466924-Alexandrium_andersonii.AAC.1